MIVAYTVSFDQLHATPDAPITVGVWIDPRDRARYVHDRTMKDVPMTLRNIARAVGLDVAPLEEARQLYADRYSYEPDPTSPDRESNVLATERCQPFVNAALQVLEQPGRYMERNWSRGPGFKSAMSEPGFQRMAEQRILHTLHERPEGMVEVIAAWMVLMATTPEEVDEAAERRSIAQWRVPKRVRKLSRTAGEIVELWYLPPPHHESLQHVELLIVRLELPVIPDPDRPGEHPGVAANIGRRDNGPGYVTVLGGRRDGEQLGTFACTSGNHTDSTYRVILQLSTTGILPATDAGDGDE